MRLFISVFLLLSFSLQAQQLGQISGRVVDTQSELPLPGATVVLDGTTIGAVTDMDGYFIIENVPTASYNIRCSYIGFQSKTLFNIIVKSVGTPPLLFKLTEAENELDEIVVSESPFKTSKETPLSVQTFSAVEIETYPGGNNDITKVVQSMPGISPSIGGFRNDIIIRGGAPNETVYYLDGIEIPNINHFSTQGSAGGPVGMLNVSFVREVTLASSAFGAEYDNPLSGVLAFEQREGNPNGFAGNFRVGASEAALTLEGPLFKKADEAAKTTALFSVRRSYLQFVFELVGLPIRPDYWDYQWKIQHKIDKYNTLNFIGLGSIDDFSVKAPEEFDAEQQATLEQVPIIQQKSITAGISWNRKFKDGNGQQTLALSTNRLDNLFSRYQDNENLSGLLFENDSFEWETKLRFNSIHYKNDWKWSWGFNLQNSSYENNTQIVRSQLNYSSTIDFLKYGVYVKGSRSFWENRLDFSWGIRTDADSFLEDSNPLQHLSPRVSLSYALSSDGIWKLNASAGRYFKLPPYTMLGYRGQNNELLNKNIQYTLSDHLVAGIEYNLGGAARITTELFYKNYGNYPISVLDGISLANKGADFEVLGNEAVRTDGSGESLGVELLYQQKLSKNFYGVFAYTYFKSQFTGSDGRYLPSVWDSRHLLSFSGGYKLPKNWEISSRWRYAGKTPYVPTDTAASLAAYPEIILDYNRLGENYLNPFSVADIRIDKKWNFDRFSFNFYFEVQNFLAQEVPQPEEYGLSRNANGEINQPLQLEEVNVNSSAIPLPSFGLVLDF
ncbi:MAG: TonB-dependent receptor [Flavobacteriaceae bacterium]